MNSSISATRILFFLLCSYCLLLPYSLRGQAFHLLDSLRAVAQTQTGIPQVNNYLQVSKQHRILTTDPDSSRFYAGIALSLAETIDYHLGMAWAYLMIGNTYSDYSQFDSANVYFAHALKEAEASEDLEMIAGVYNNRGTNYIMQDLYELALKDFFISLEIEEKRGEKGSFQRVYGNIALIYSAQGQPERGLPYLKKALGFAQAAHDTMALIQDYNNLTNFYTQMNVLDSAKRFAEQVLSLSQAVGLQEGIARAGDLLGDIAIRSGDFETSLAWTQRGIEAAESLQMPERNALLYLNLSRVYDTLGRSAEAVNAGEQALLFARQSKVPRNVLEVQTQMASIHAHAGHPAQALIYLEQAHHLKDSLFSIEKTQQLSKLQTEFETERKQKAIEDLEQKMEIRDLKIQQRSILGLAILILAILGLAALYLYNRQRVLQEQQCAMEARQQALRTQMNPHFLFHALSSIQDYLYSHEKPETATGYLGKFAKLMRLILENSREDLIPLDQEIQTLKTYLDLQQIRYQHGFSYDLHLDPAIEADRLLIPPMVAQPFIENALEHGRIQEQVHGKLMIHIHLREGRLNMRVEDNGIGRKAAAARARDRDHRSLATEITEDRLALIRRSSKQAVDLSITDKILDGEVEGVIVSLSLPIIWKS